MLVIQTTGMCERQLDLAIGGFELREMTACGSIMSDGAIDAQVILDNCLMDDLRKGKETGITRYALVTIRVVYVMILCFY